ncbi:MAG: hypothetical protein IT290_04395 [Deltaproteobacteria bacterium]|nr:hypothetical protein [Deltaproteobacteria bacterium]
MKNNYIELIQQRLTTPKKRLTIDPLEQEMVRLLAQNGPGRELKFVDLVGKFIDRERDQSLPIAVNC